MKKTILFIFSIVITFFIISCDCKFEKRIYDFQQIKFKIPFGKENIPDYRLIVYFDSTVCNSCGYNSLFLWEEMISFAETHPEKLEIFFIFSPRKDDFKKMLNLYSTGIYDIHLDSTHVFVKSNPKFTKMPIFNTFLLNREGNAILMGSPLFNSKLYKLYCEVIGIKNIKNSIVDNVVLASDSSLSFNHRVYNVGSIKQGDTVDIDIIVANNTQEDIILLNVENSCTCISTNAIIHTIIPAKKSKKLTIHFHATYMGNFYHIISICNSYSGLASEIALQGSVEGI